MFFFLSLICLLFGFVVHLSYDESYELQKYNIQCECVDTIFCVWFRERDIQKTQTDALTDTEQHISVWLVFMRVTKFSI